MDTGIPPGHLYALLPALYRVEDERLAALLAAPGAPARGPLRTLLDVMEAQARLLDADVAQLYDDFFVETARAWVVPYLGDLVGNRLLHTGERPESSATALRLFPDLAGPDLRPDGVVRLRADVARTIRYRLRKGTPAMLEALARDVTGWAVHLVECFETLGWTRHLDHLRLHAPGTAELRSPEAMGRVGGAFDPAPYTVDVRPVATAAGRHGLRGVAFFAWRLRSLGLQGVDAARASAVWQYHVSPLNAPAPLFARQRREDDETGLAGEPDVPGPLRPAAFLADLRRNAGRPHTDFYGDFAVHRESSFALFFNGTLVPPAKLRCANLSQWKRPAGDAVAVDVRRGRIAFGTAWPSGDVRVSYHHGFPGALGGGPYSRRKWLVSPALPGVTRITVARDVPADETSVRAALLRWRNAGCPDAVITILDNRTYAESLAIVLPNGAWGERWLAIEAADGRRPHLRPVGGVFTIGGEHPGASLTLNGLLVEGGVEIDGSLGRLRVLHSTLVPGRRRLPGGGEPGSMQGSIRARVGSPTRPANAGLRVEVAFSVTGALFLPPHAGGAWVLDSIVDGLPDAGHPDPPQTAFGAPPAGAGPPLWIERSTVLGRVHTDELTLASESIFTGRVVSSRLQEGCVRFCWLPPASLTPRAYRCQPALETETRRALRRDALLAGGGTLSPGWDAGIAAGVAAWLVPAFTSIHYGHPGYAQLSGACPAQVSRGAEDDAEMGAWHHLMQPQREANLRIRLDEYLPVGLESGVFHVT